MAGELQSPAELDKSLVVVLNSRPKSGGYTFESDVVIEYVITSNVDFAVS